MRYTRKTIRKIIKSQSYKLKSVTDFCELYLFIF